MASNSRASPSDPSRASSLPLIMCPDCRSRKVVKRISKKDWNFGGSILLLPESPEAYADEVESLGNNGKIAVSPGPGQCMQQIRFGGNTGSSSHWMMMREDEALVVIGREIVTLLKAMCFMCGLVVFVLLKILFGALIKH
ncbi:hypothetical protein BS78_01G288800 [Paspalum vaginatum]|nr:hypothetical protein BS78_01G288800 [Paspalum vaginatum]